MNLLSQLNPKQQEAVVQTEGPVLILAGAGSGKTRTLTHRVAYLIKEKGVNPQNILAVTFTNKAAGEMADRIKELLGLPKEAGLYSAGLPTMGTFHSICVRILRREIEKIGYSNTFVIYDDQDQKALMRRVMKDLDISDKEIKPTVVLNVISSAKNKLQNAKEYEQEINSYQEELIAKCFYRYQRELKQADALDFDDLIMKTVQVLEMSPPTLNYYQQLFRYILVDEYQDTNKAQYKLLRMLARAHQNICVVGDDYQSVYRWRGADISNILNFEKDYKKTKIILLEQNYRSTQTILDVADCVIKNNENQKRKKLWTDNDAGELVTLYQAYDEKEEARFVVEEIADLQDKTKIKLNEVAILYRTNAQSRALEEAFMKAGMPYKIIGGLKFYQRKEIKDIVAYLYFINNPKDRVSFERIVNEPKRGLGGKTIQKVIELSDEYEGNILKTLGKLFVAKGEGNLNLPDGKIKDLENFGKMIEKFKKYSQKNHPRKLIEKVYKETGYEAMLDKMGDEGAGRQENILELLTVAGEYNSELDHSSQFTVHSNVDEENDEKEESGLGLGVENKELKSTPNPSFIKGGELKKSTPSPSQVSGEELKTPQNSRSSNFDPLYAGGGNLLQKFLEDVTLVSQTDRDLEFQEAVPLMTIHSAKGLEYKVVFVVGTEEGLFPHSRATMDNQEMEEERRLCYVAITRAKEKLYFVYTTMRNIYGSTQTSIKSRFIDEVDDEFFDIRQPEITLESGNSGFSDNKNNFDDDWGDDFSSEFSDAWEDVIEIEEENKIEENNQWVDGDKVFHKEFGEGIVVSNDEKIITVAFAGVGVKKLSKKLVKLKKS